ncbi:transcriptional regulator, GntR family [Kribbella flavida DSM 17836]|uniref:Transcriptional regulator, GntR family n=1 Tax=Kribbella flavida (strain DSM 17836 / JCM 10339 / NBRC 14399) TaxID=479435 RepID=D2PS37_KRIFD|nr:GntR family transcriptional regulator [Kribbella flavida]ADB31161.1 transcriptional regulator, GntR family [Kribbella flavida DSM 17836]
MPPKLVRPAPPYQQIANEIRGRISNGELQAGDLVPSVRSLMRDYGVAIATAQRALSTLRAEGYIKPERGVGSIVTTEEERGRAANDRVDKSRRTGKVYPTGQYAKITEAVLGEASEQVADALGVKVGSQVVQRVRTTYRVDGKPISASTSYFRGDLAERAPMLLSAERIKEGTFAYVANVLKRTVDAWQDQFEPANATAAQAGQLGLDEGALIMVGRNWIYDDRGDVLEYGESITYGRVTYRGRLGD